MEADTYGNLKEAAAAAAAAAAPDTSAVAAVAAVASAAVASAEDRGLRRLHRLSLVRYAGHVLHQMYCHRQIYHSQSYPKVSTVT